MKKLAIFLSIVMILALAVPTFAATLTIDGELKPKIRYERVDQSTSGTVTGGITLKLTSKIVAPAGVSMTISATTGDVTRTFPGSDINISVPTNFKIKNIAVTITGPYRTGGQNLTTVIGDYKNVNNANVRGYSITGLKLGDSLSGIINWFPNTSIVKLDKAGKELSGYLQLESTAGDVSYKGSATVRPNDKVDVTGTFEESGVKYNFTTNIKATDNVKLYGKIDQASNYDVNATLGLADMIFKPTVKAGYEKVDAATGFYVQGDAVIDKLNTQARYNDRTKVTKLFAGTGDIYSWAAVSNKVPDPFADIRAGVATNSEAYKNVGKAGYVLMYNQTATAKDMQLSARLNLKDFIDFGANTTVTARANLKNDLKTGTMTENLIGLVVTTKVSVAGFNNITLDGSVSSNLKSEGNVYGITAKYTAPNQLAFTASYKNKCVAAPWGGFDGKFWIEATRTIKF
jgi:hypothetical protein